MGARMVNFFSCDTDGFFEFMAERERIRRRKDLGQSKPWTRDTILQQYKFTNVFRECDKTTVWFRENVRKPLYHDAWEVYFATVAFRWFNRIETGKRLLNYLLGRRQWDSAKIEQLLRPYPPYTNAAYIIKTPDGMSKLEGVLWCIQNFVGGEAEDKFREFMQNRNRLSLQDVWKHLVDYPYMGPFMAYEVVTDLRHTIVGQYAEDIRTWANAGPGAKRGLNRLLGRPLEKRLADTQILEEMNKLFEVCLDRQIKDITTPWYGVLEMREIEHTLCEFDKYQRAALGQGRPKQRYNGVSDG